MDLNYALEYWNSRNKTNKYTYVKTIHHQHVSIGVATFIRVTYSSNIRIQKICQTA